VKEPRRGPIGRATGLAEGVAAAVRRYQQGRESRVVVAGEDGITRIVVPGAPGFERALEAAEHMVALADLPADDPSGAP
jgi:hypothetical protein